MAPSRPGDRRPRLMAVTCRATGAHRIRRIGGLHFFLPRPFGERVGVRGLWRWMHRLAGICARRRTHFLLRRQKKVGKEKATPLAVSLRFAAGNLRCSRLGRCCGTRFVHCAHFAQTTAASQNTKHGHAALPMPAPAAALLGTARGEWKPHTGHRCARPRQVPVSNPCGCACGAVIAGWRVHRRMHALRALTRRGCLNGARQRAVSSAAHPASAVTQVCPVATRRGRRLGGAFFCLLFLCAQEK